MGIFEQRFERGTSGHLILIDFIIFYSASEWLHPTAAEENPLLAGLHPASGQRSKDQGFHPW